MLASHLSRRQEEKQAGSTARSTHNGTTSASSSNGHQNGHVKEGKEGAAVASAGGSDLLSMLLTAHEADPKKVTRQVGR